MIPFFILIGFFAVLYIVGAIVDKIDERRRSEVLHPHDESEI